MTEKRANLGGRLQTTPPRPSDDIAANRYTQGRDCSTRQLDLEVADGVELQHVTGIKLWLMLASVTLVAFLMLLDMSIIVTAIPKITDEFHSLTDVGWYGSAFLLAKYVSVSRCTKRSCSH